MRLLGLRFKAESACYWPLLSPSRERRKETEHGTSLNSQPPHRQLSPRTLSNSVSAYPASQSPVDSNRPSRGSQVPSTRRITSHCRCPESYHIALPVSRVIPGVPSHHVTSHCRCPESYPVSRVISHRITSVPSPITSHCRYPESYPLST